MKSTTKLLGALAISAVLAACGSDPTGSQGQPMISAAPGHDHIELPGAPRPSGVSSSGSAPGTGSSGSSSPSSAPSGSSSSGTTPPSAPPPSSNPIVAYYASWSKTAMPTSSIPWAHVTHLAHAFVLPSPAGGLSSIASYVDTDLIAQAHAHGVKVVASVGGAGAVFDANTNPAARAATVSDLASLCRSYGYDGIDIDWEFPDATTAPAWGALISELRVALDGVRPGLTISAAISPSMYNALPVASLNALSWVGVMTYDYAGAWSATSGHVAPLYPTSGGDGGSVSQTIDGLIAYGVPASHLFIGLPFYGATFGASAIASTPVAPSTSPTYRDIAATPAADGWTSQWDATAQVPYLQRAASPGFLSYDDARSIGAKCSFAKSRGLGGAIVWELSGDRLSDGSDPLLDAAQSCR